MLGEIAPFCLIERNTRGEIRRVTPLRPQLIKPRRANRKVATWSR
jgi:hypothetical protein